MRRDATNEAALEMLFLRVAARASSNATCNLSNKVVAYLYSAMSSAERALIKACAAAEMGYVDKEAFVLSGLCRLIVPRGWPLRNSVPSCTLMSWIDSSYRSVNPKSVRFRSVSMASSSKCFSFPG